MCVFRSVRACVCVCVCVCRCGSAVDQRRVGDVPSLPGHTYYKEVDVAEPLYDVEEVQQEIDKRRDEGGYGHESYPGAAATTEQHARTDEHQQI